jgi:hypothetical protein
LRGSIAAVLALTVAIGLSGCESYGLGPAAISREGSNLLVAVCEDLAAASIYGTIDSVEAGYDWVPFLDISGDAVLQAATEAGPDSIPPGLAGTWGTVDFKTLGAVNISFVGTDPDVGFLASFNNGGRQLEVAEGKWLQTNGVETDLPCPNNIAS